MRRRESGSRPAGFAGGDPGGGLAGGTPGAGVAGGAPPWAFAGLLPRVAAVAVDLLVLSCVFFPSTRLVKGTWIMSPSEHRWSAGWFVSDPLCLAFLVTMFLYFVLLEGLSGATPGKRLLRLRVVNASGMRAGLGRALIRNVLRVVDGLPTLGILGGVLIVVTSERTRVGDMLAGTRVVRSGTMRCRDGSDGQGPREGQ